MKRLIRWLIAPLYYWVSDVPKCGPAIARESGHVAWFILDGLGRWHIFTQTPDAMRDAAWYIIGLADEAERIKEGLS